MKKWYTWDMKSSLLDFSSYREANIDHNDNEKAEQKAKQGAESTQLEVVLTLRKSKSNISTHINKYITMTQKRKSFGKPWETLATLDTIPRHLGRAEAVACFRLTTGHDFLGVYIHWLAWLLTRPASSATISEWKATTYFNALDSMNTRLMTLSVGTGRLGVKWL
ncbi:uncharacterized protein TNCV_3652551 [Trichonephila clavipes]|nr:uncharacterized protein TNCV_3652551 [Trichonephila clavipes]